MNATSPLRTPSAGRRGSLLIIVLWVALGLVTLALYFGGGARLAYQASANALAGRQAEQAIEGAIRYALFVLDYQVEEGRRPLLEEGSYQPSAPLGEAAFWFIGRGAADDLTQTEPAWGLVDEASKLNLNTATIEMLEALPNMTADLAAAIVDWRDADEELSPGGAESTDYETLDFAYSAKNGEFESIEELRLVLGVDEMVLWGEDRNANGILDPNENDGEASWPPDNADGRLDAGLAEYVTVWTRQPNTDPDGEPRLNLRGDSVQQDLRQMLVEQLDESKANDVMARLGGRLGQIESPLEFLIESGLTPEEFARVEPYLTVGDGDYRVGLVNVCVAPAAVLACLPGMDESQAEALVAARRDLDPAALESIAWVAAVLEEEVAREVGPWITAESWQFSLDIAAVGANGRGLRREWVVVDNEDQARVIYRRDRSRMGAPFDLSAARAQLKTITTIN
ncbi:MAG TPA: type II secretion system protein GspK [Candidatus Sumerlaeota bacterium]|nr:MAG: General secretion pathway protein K [candidate division BRC1 bacterium ADurb.BinA292]HOE95005.1 type II secretion system protein GspK [Candidatus Sumerlaeota bacterium]HOR26446.1 type II secretion system protein GspK [Candidatus Sumerlaeota bacterium]HPK00830.1 type II secretion system protein GspK [Candidatus Sumerlaeota bacterium]